jgi:hypothetical protein
LSVRPSRFFGNVFLACYLWLAVCAFIVTVIRIPVPWPRDPIVFLYGTMAPYQSYGYVHNDMVAEGQLPDGSWKYIDLLPYYPVLFGEGAVRRQQAGFRYVNSQTGTLAIRQRYAQRLLEMERAKGNDYRAVRLNWEWWPNMTGPYEENRFPAATNRRLLIEQKYE